jgi:hypothetical protein
LLVEQLQSIAAPGRSELSRLTDAFLLLAQHLEPGTCPSARQLLDALLPNELERRAGTPTSSAASACASRRTARAGCHRGSSTSSAASCSHRPDRRARRRPGRTRDTAPTPPPAGRLGPADLPRRAAAAGRSTSAARRAVATALRRCHRQRPPRGPARQGRAAPVRSPSRSRQPCTDAPAPAARRLPPAPACPAASSAAGGATAPSPASCSASATRSSSSATPNAP